MAPKKPSLATVSSSEIRFRAIIVNHIFGTKLEFGELCAKSAEAPLCALRREGLRHFWRFWRKASRQSPKAFRLHQLLVQEGDGRRVRWLP